MKQDYKIKIDVERVIGKINPNIYGHFIEHLGRCIYGGIYEEDSSLSDERGFRKDVLGVVRKIRCPILRWPGGNFASNYHWEDGIGLKDERPVRFDLAWCKEETNRFGTDEFIEYCRAIEAEPYICVNLGTGTLDEAIHWLEYCNSSGNTYYARLRAKNGHPEPYKVKYWGVGNENYGGWQVGHRSAKEYAKVLREYAKFMKVVDPNIKIIAVGADDPDWDLEVVKVAGEYIDYISIHKYLGSNDYYETVASVYWVKKRLNILEGIIRAYQPERKDIKITFDEWNIWYRSGPNESLEENYALKDGLFTAGVLLILQKMCNTVAMANLAQLVNVIGAIHTEKKGLYLTSIYHAFDLFVNHTGRIVLDPLIVSEKYSTKISHCERKVSGMENFPYLDASVTLSEDKKRMYLAVLNYHQEEKIDCSLVLEGFLPQKEANIYELNGPDVVAVNDFKNPYNIRVVAKNINYANSHFTYPFPPHSATVIEFH
jgi:alpha-N-arabinofuranosidase